MKLIRPTLLAGLLCLAVFGSALPASALDALDLVKKSQTAEKYVSYRGFKFADIAVGDRTVRAHFKIVHLKPDKTRTDYFLPDELAGIITIDRGSDSWRFLPSQGKWQHNKWELSPKPMNLALKNYNVVSAGKSTVAGRSAHVVKLVPKKRGNPSETLWIDAQYYLPLKSELRNSSGKIISVSAFREIRFEPKDISDSAFQVDERAKPPNNPVPELGFEVVKPTYVPKGYKLVNVSTIKIGSGYAAHLMYTNGVNTISIFERKRGGKDSGGDMPGLGKWANLVRFDRGRITYTLIGDISKKELERIGSSLK